MLCRPRPLAWALLVRPLGAQTDIALSGLRDEIWDAFSSQAVGLGFVSSPLWGSKQARSAISSDDVRRQGAHELGGRADLEGVLAASRLEVGSADLRF